uniref:Polyvinylalcohol dehydrogenase n=1 Tax=Schlesneria paludicola TaxID=360056 RepID=A0A7C4QRY6_9PLAN
MMRRMMCGMMAALMGLAMSAPAAAAVVAGTLEAVSPETRELTVRVGKQQVRTTFKLAPTAEITLQGKKADLNQLQAGQLVTVTTSTQGNLATKIAARIPAEPAAEKPDKTETADKPDKAEKPARSAPAKSRNRKDLAEEPTQVAPGDWPQFRGPTRDLHSAETGLLTEWPPQGPELLWKVDGLGEGYSSVSIAGETIYTMGTIGDDEHLFALSKADGSRRWTVRTGANRPDGTGNGPRSTPTVDGEFVYALGAHGDLVCAHADSGEIVWRMNVVKEARGDVPTWGICESVLIDGDKLICTPGGSAATMVALNKRTGKPLWATTVDGRPAAAYSSPIVIEAGGVRQYVNFVHTGVVGIRASDGKPLWMRSESANGTANCSSPLYADGHVFTASAYGTGGALFRLASSGGQTRAELVFETKQMKNHHGGMLLLDGHVYGFDEGVLTCLNLSTGRPAWQNRSVGKGSLAYADGHLYLRSEEGPLALAEATPRAYVEKGRFSQPERSGRPAWAHPVVAGGRLYIRDQDKLFVFNVKN